MKIKAKITSHTNGYLVDQERVRALGEVGDVFTMSDAAVSSYNSAIWLEGNELAYNSVNFEFTWEDGSPANIYAMERFQSY